MASPAHRDRPSTVLAAKDNYHRVWTPIISREEKNKPVVVGYKKELDDKSAGKKQRRLSLVDDVEGGYNLTLFELQSRFGDKPLIFFSSLSSTAVLKGLTLLVLVRAASRGLI